MENTVKVIRQVLLQQYGLEVVTMEKSAVGAGADTWFVTCKDDKYVMKYPAVSEINNPKLEPELCEYLNQHGIPACQFIKNLQGDYLSHDSLGRVFHVQKFIEGRMYEWNTAPSWLLFELAGLLGKIHTVLKDYQGLLVGIGENFFKFLEG